VDCYIKTFFGEIINSSSELSLELGTNYNVKSITWERLTSTGYIALQKVSPVQALNFSYTDNSPVHGLNTYRAKIELSNGMIIYSGVTTLYFSQEPYLVYPNPVPQYHDIIVINSSPDITQLQVFNATGMKVLEHTLSDWSNTISTNRLGAGIYLLRVLKGSELQQTLKLVVY